MIQLEDFLKTFKGHILQGRKGFRKARHYIQKGEKCVLIFHNWWVCLENGADWMRCLKLTERMNDWSDNNGAEEITPLIGGKKND